MNRNLPQSSPWDQGNRARAVDFVANASGLFILWLLYGFIRTLTTDDWAVAFANSADLLAFQQRIGLPSEQAVQELFLGSTGVLRAANVYYMAVHFPLTAGFLVWAWARNRSHFDRIRNTLVAVTGAGLVLHVAFPLAPPRMIEGFVDTAAHIGPNPYDLGIASAANQIAAMPSLHVGWALLLALGVLWLSESRWRYFALLHPLVTVLVVVVSANHYWLDAIVAALLVFGGWLLMGRGASYTGEQRASADLRARARSHAERIV